MYMYTYICIGYTCVYIDTIYIYYMYKYTRTHYIYSMYINTHAHTIYIPSANDKDTCTDLLTLIRILIY